MFYNKAKCFLSDLFTNGFEPQINPFQKQIRHHSEAAKEALGNQSYLNKKSFILSDDDEQTKYAAEAEDFFLNKVNLI